MKIRDFLQGLHLQPSWIEMRAPWHWSLPTGHLNLYSAIATSAQLDEMTTPVLARAFRAASTFVAYRGEKVEAFELAEVLPPELFYRLIYCAPDNKVLKQRMGRWRLALNQA